MIYIQDLINKYNPGADSEIEAVTEVGEAIAARMNKHKWLQWTKFPDKFANCRTDSDLYQMIDNWNGWLEETGLGTLPDELIVEDEDLDEPTEQSSTV